MDQQPPFVKQADPSSVASEAEATAVEKVIASPEDIEESLIKSLGNLRVEHNAKAKREKESVVEKKPTNEEEWRSLCVKRWADTEYVIANDFSLKKLIPALAGDLPLSYELFYSVMNDLEERTLVHGSSVVFVHPDLSAKLEERNVGDLTKDVVAVGCGQTRAAIFLPEKEKAAAAGTTSRLYVCKLNETHLDAANKQLLGDEAARKKISGMGVEHVIHWRATSIVVTNDCLNDAVRHMSITRDTVCIPLAASNLQWLVVDIQEGSAGARVIAFEPERTVMRLSVFNLDNGMHRIVAIERDNNKDRIAVLDSELALGPIEKAMGNLLTIPNDQMQWFSLTGTVSAFYLTWRQGLLTWAIAEECCYYQMKISDSEPVKHDYWGSVEEELALSNKRGAIYKSPPRQPILSLFSATGSNSAFASSADNMLFFMNSKPKPQLSVLRDTGMTISGGIVGNTVVVMRSSGEVVFSTIGGDAPGKPLQPYQLANHGAGAMPKNFSRPYPAVWCTAGRVSVLLPNGVLAIFTPFNRDDIEKLRQVQAMQRERLEADRAQQQLADGE